MAARKIESAAGHVAERKRPDRHGQAQDCYFTLYGLQKSTAKVNNLLEYPSDGNGYDGKRNEAKIIHNLIVTGELYRYDTVRVGVIPTARSDSGAQVRKSDGGTPSSSTSPMDVNHGWNNGRIAPCRTPTSLGEVRKIARDCT